MLVLIRTCILFTLLLLLPDWYIYKVYAAPRKSRLAKRLLWWPTIALLAVLYGFVISREVYQEYFGIYLIVALSIGIPKLFFVLCSLLLRGIKHLSHRKVPHGTISLFPSIAVGIYIIFGAVEGKQLFQVKEITFESADLPEAFDGYRILQLSDIHSGSWKGNPGPLQRAIQLCNDQHADLAVFTGDMVNSRSEELKEFIPVLSQLKAKDGVYSILGNHDYGLYSSWPSEAARLADVDSLVCLQNEMGWEMLNNDHRIIHHCNDSIALIGVENSGNPPFPNLGDLDRACQNTDGMFKILLSHDPTHWRRNVLPETDIQLMLAGHTHDMQISVFGFSFSKFVYPEHNGMYYEGNRGLYVNIGLGHVLFPMRLGAWPEITVITLKKV